ncbi:MAG: dephospho-CoA kinase [Treponema sp.]|nr:dephospho-CoA kinase [Treponema sp.]
MIIGLTGKYCAGKNHVAAILEERGLPVLDVDKLGHQALETEKPKILALFGNDLIKADGSLDKRLLGQRVFGKPEKLAALEAIVHPEANRLTDVWVAAQSNHCVVNAALLHKSSVFNRLDRIIIVTAPFLTRFFRAKRRDRLPCREIIRRFASQKDFHSYYLPINANPIYAETYKVENSGLYKKGLCSRNQTLKNQIDKILEGIIHG